MKNFTLCNETTIWYASKSINVCVCMHLSMCELFVCPPQALGCWVCSLKRLCFCCHPSLPPSPPLTRTLFFLSFSVSASFAVSLQYICIPLSMLYHNCWQDKILQDGLIRRLSRPAQGMTLCFLRGKLVSAGSLERIIKLFMQWVWPLTISLLVWG